MDTAVARFVSRTGLACPEGCGHCCSSEKVEATVLECIPLAFELFRSLQAELILKRLLKNVHGRQCVLYRADYTASGQWGCTQYLHLHPGLGTIRMPINKAVREALLKVGMMLDLANPATASAQDDHEDPPNKPMLPAAPVGRRAA
ncbi:MAG: hypothetical protein ABR512_16035 [Desulfopila sp.]